MRPLNIFDTHLPTNYFPESVDSSSEDNITGWWFSVSSRSQCYDSDTPLYDTPSILVFTSNRSTFAASSRQAMARPFMLFLQPLPYLSNDVLLFAKAKASERCCRQDNPAVIVWHEQATTSSKHAVGCLIFWEMSKKMKMTTKRDKKKRMTIQRVNPGKYPTIWNLISRDNKVSSCAFTFCLRRNLGKARVPFHFFKCFFDSPFFKGVSITKLPNKVTDTLFQGSQSCISIHF